MDLADLLDDFATRFGAPTIIVGAAASRRAPACYPTVKDYYGALLSEVGRRHVLRATDPIWRDLDPTRIAFELVMERCDEALTTSGTGSGPMVPLLGSVFGGDRAPNPNHVAIVEALLTRRARAVLTVNFDTALSRVDSDVKTIDDEPGLMDFAHNFGQLAEESRIVAHLHSSVRHSGQLKAFMSQVGEPVLGPAASVILAAKNAGPLLLVGYAAADPDLRPFFCRKSKCDEDDGVWKTTRSDPASGRDLHIDLDPGHSFDPKPTERAIRQVLDGFDDADVLRLVGVLRNCANESSAAIRDLTLAQGARPSLPGALELGRALEAAGLFRRAARALGSPPSRTEAMYGAWALERGFYLRQSGDFSRALDQYVEARQCLERADPQNARTLASLAYREIECRVLMASGTRPESRSSALRACYELIRACERWTALVPARPHFELDFYRAEIDLLDGNYGRALDEYSEFERRSARWRPGYWSTVAEIRKCLCLIGLGHRAAALRLWRASLRHAARDRSLLRLFQNLAVAPMFVGGADAWFWRSRRVFAVHVYPRYEALKSGWLSVTAALRQG